MNKNTLRRTLKKSEIGRTMWGVLHKVNIYSQLIFTDEQYFKRKYRKLHGEELNLQDPQTFDAKQLWVKCYYRNPLYTKCSDKYLVREYVKECGLADILNPLYGVYDRVQDIEWDKLPDRFYLKANHASASNFRCDSKATFDKDKAERGLRRALRSNYYYASREWNYRDIKPKIIAEAIIEDAERKPLVDYRFLCYNGTCEYIFIDIGTADETGKHKEDARRNVYDRDMNLLDVKVSRSKFPPELVQKPENFQKMREYAEILSKSFPFCRVDLYNVDGNILFGEITFFHSGGLSSITPKEWEFKLGKDINIELYRQELAERKKK